jgi:uncharacterized delta-60 repeat protein
MSAGTYPNTDELISFTGASRVRPGALAIMLLALLATVGCGSGGGGSAALPPPPASIGPAGGTVTGPAGSQVVVPAGALTTNTDIAIAESSVGAPALPVGATSAGSIFAFTPHGTQFASAVTISVPFDPTKVPAGAVPTLYKTNAAQSAFEVVVGATVNGNNMSGPVTGFSYATVATPPTSAIEPVAKTWSIIASGHGANDTIVPHPGEMSNCNGCSVDVNPFIGEPQTLVPSLVPTASIYSSPSGRLFWTRALAPHTNIASDPSGPAGHSKYTAAISTLTEKFSFKANQDSPTLSFLISAARVEAMDYGGAVASPEFCTWLLPGYSTADFINQCLWKMSDARTHFDLRATNHTTGKMFFDTGSTVQLRGQHDLSAVLKGWAFSIQQTNTHRFWSLGSNFNFSDDVDADGNHRHAKIELVAPAPVVVPLQDIKKDDEITVVITVWTASDNLIQGESSVEASLQDPLSTSGLDMVTAGLTQIPVRSDDATSLPPLTCTTGVDPAAGVLQLSNSDYAELESNREAGILMSRSGGTAGEVGVRLKTRNASAIAGSDYLSVDQEVRFADGEDGERLISVALVDDAVIEPLETADVLLSDVGGCAQLGTRTSATLTILDDDTPRAPPPSTYTVGGTVTGLTGTGLVLHEVSGGSNVTALNGEFTFPATLYSGLGYEVRVETQPTNPIQICTVANAVGTITNANVTNVAVTCATPAPNGSLDPGFGNGGKIASNIAFTTNVVDARMGMALQADGRILLVGGLQLARFNGDGTPDVSFGSAGVVTVPFNGSPYDIAQGVAVQTDGRIVVVGTLSVGGTAADKQDFALARFNSDGALDISFGTGGIVTTDFNGSQDIARRITIQADGKLLVAGYSTVVAPTLTENQFALARYNVDGSPDTSFAAGLGRVTTGFGGTVNWVQGLTQQRDGKIVVAGITALNGGTPNRNVGVARYLGASMLINGHIVGPGWQDPDFNDPDLGGSLTGGQISSDLNRGGGEAADVVEQQGIDGQLLVAVNVGKFGLATFINITDTSNGKVYGGNFPPPLLPTLVDFSGQTDQVSAMALQADGKVLMVGRSDIYGANPDMAIARLSPGTQSASLDTTFGNAGKVTVDFFGAFDRAEAVAVQPDGKIVVGGYARNAGTTVFALARLLP